MSRKDSSRGEFSEFKEFVIKTLDEKRAFKIILDEIINLTQILEKSTDDENLITNVCQALQTTKHSIFVRAIFEALSHYLRRHPLEEGLVIQNILSNKDISKDAATYKYMSYFVKNAENVVLLWSGALKDFSLCAKSIEEFIAVIFSSIKEGSYFDKLKISEWIIKEVSRHDQEDKSLKYDRLRYILSKFPYKEGEVNAKEDLTRIWLKYEAGKMNFIELSSIKLSPTMTEQEILSIFLERKLENFQNGKYDNIYSFVDFFNNNASSILSLPDQLKYKAEIISAIFNAIEKFPLNFFAEINTETFPESFLNKRAEIIEKAVKLMAMNNVHQYEQCNLSVLKLLDKALSKKDSSYDSPYGKIKEQILLFWKQYFQETYKLTGSSSSVPIYDLVRAVEYSKTIDCCDKSLKDNLLKITNILLENIISSINEENIAKALSDLKYIIPLTQDFPAKRNAIIERVKEVITAKENLNKDDIFFFFKSYSRKFLSDRKTMVRVIEKLALKPLKNVFPELSEGRIRFIKELPSQFDEQKFAIAHLVITRMLDLNKVDNIAAILHQGFGIVNEGIIQFANKVYREENKKAQLLAICLREGVISESCSKEELKKVISSFENDAFFSYLENAVQIKFGAEYIDIFQLRKERSKIIYKVLYGALGKEQIAEYINLAAMLQLQPYLHQDFVLICVKNSIENMADLVIYSELNATINTVFSQYLRPQLSNRLRDNVVSKLSEVTLVRRKELNLLHYCFSSILPRTVFDISIITNHLEYCDRFLVPNKKTDLFKAFFQEKIYPNIFSEVFDIARCDILMQPTASANFAISSNGFVNNFIKYLHNKNILAEGSLAKNLLGSDRVNSLAVIPDAARPSAADLMAYLILSDFNGAGSIERFCELKSKCDSFSAIMKSVTENPRAFFDIYKGGVNIALELAKDMPPLLIGNAIVALQDELHRRGLAEAEAESARAAKRASAKDRGPRKKIAIEKIAPAEAATEKVPPEVAPEASSVVEDATAAPLSQEKQGERQNP